MNSILYNIRLWSRRSYRIIVHSVNAFGNNNDYLKASALTLYTLISIVPFLAVAFGIAAGFGFEQYLEEQLKHLFDEQPEMISYAIQFARSLLRDTKGSLITGIGLIALLWTNLSLLGNIESALNDIWRVKTPRSWAKKLTDYLAVMILCPLFFVVSSSVNVYFMTQITATAKENRLLELMSPYLILMMQMMPILLSILLFVVMYLFIPNAKLQTFPRILAGIFAGIIFQIWQWVYIKFQVEISHYGAIYGTFAALPLFLIWLQVSWLIVLAGAELAAHIENEMTYWGDKNSAKLWTVTQKELALLIVYNCVQAFNKGKPPMSAVQISSDLEAPLMNVQQILDALTDQGILVEVGGYESRQVAYQPRMDARLITIKKVCDAINQKGQWKVAVESTPILEQMIASLHHFDQLTEESESNFTFEKLVTLEAND